MKKNIAFLLLIIIGGFTVKALVFTDSSLSGDGTIDKPLSINQTLRKSASTNKTRSGTDEVVINHVLKDNMINGLLLDTGVYYTDIGNTLYIKSKKDNGDYISKKMDLLGVDTIHIGDTIYFVEPVQSANGTLLANMTFPLYQKDFSVPLNELYYFDVHMYGVPMNIIAKNRSGVAILTKDTLDGYAHVHMDITASRVILHLDGLEPNDSVAWVNRRKDESIYAGYFKFIKMEDGSPIDTTHWMAHDIINAPIDHLTQLDFNAINDDEDRSPGDFNSPIYICHVNTFGVPNDTIHWIEKIGSLLAIHHINTGTVEYFANFLSGQQPPHIRGWHFLAGFENGLISFDDLRNVGLFSQKNDKMLTKFIISCNAKGVVHSDYNYVLEKYGKYYALKKVNDFPLPMCMLFQAPHFVEISTNRGYWIKNRAIVNYRRHYDLTDQDRDYTFRTQECFSMDMSDNWDISDASNLQDSATVYSMYNSGWRRQTIDKNVARIFGALPDKAMPHPYPFKGDDMSSYLVSPDDPQRKDPNGALWNFVPCLGAPWYTAHERNRYIMEFYYPGSEYIYYDQYEPIVKIYKNQGFKIISLKTIMNDYLAPQFHRDSNHPIIIPLKSINNNADVCVNDTLANHSWLLVYDDVNQKILIPTESTTLFETCKAWGDSPNYNARMYKGNLDKKLNYGAEMIYGDAFQVVSTTSPPIIAEGNRFFIDNRTNIKVEYGYTRMDSLVPITGTLPLRVGDYILDRFHQLKKIESITIASKVQKNIIGISYQSAAVQLLYMNNFTFADPIGAKTIIKFDRDDKYFYGEDGSTVRPPFENGFLVVNHNNSLGYFDGLNTITSIHTDVSKERSLTFSIIKDTVHSCIVPNKILIKKAKSFISFKDDEGNTYYWDEQGGLKIKNKLGETVIQKIFSMEENLSFLSKENKSEKVHLLLPDVLNNREKKEYTFNSRDFYENNLSIENIDSYHSFLHKLGKPKNKEKGLSISYELLTENCSLLTEKKSMKEWIKNVWGKLIYCICHK